MRFNFDLTGDKVVLVITRADVQWSDIKEKPIFDELYKTIQEEKNFTGSTVKTVTGVTQTTNGEINVTFEEIDFPDPVDISGKKDKQEVVTKTATQKYATKVEQNENGEITVTYDNINLATGSTQGTVSIDGVDVAVNGLGSAAYTEASAYATAA